MVCQKLLLNEKLSLTRKHVPMNSAVKAETKGTSPQGVTQESKDVSTERLKCNSDNP